MRMSSFDALWLVLYGRRDLFPLAIKHWLKLVRDLLNL
ncbi:MAG: hypothetical protein M2R45_00138 [Verrucomicrobia subdivision 3 bacterium]|nr:hypothetical protein [Limisphaerales bacterium]MCS1412402.1 hypothetical protein [Limisphaerales bacterium]